MKFKSFGCWMRKELFSFFEARIQNSRHEIKVVPDGEQMTQKACVDGLDLEPKKKRKAKGAKSV